MKIAIVVSEQDPAGINIKEELLRLFQFEMLNEKFEDSIVYEFNKNARLYTTKSDSIFCEDIDKEINADMFIFATKHKSQAGIPSLSVHAPGNWGEAEMGGKNNSLCISPADYIKEALIHLEQYNELGYDVVQECTHHGPYLEKPVMFIEIGSSEEQWTNKQAAQIIAKTIIALISTSPIIYRTAVGIGGLHTTPNFKKIVLRSDIAVGHVCPKYHLQDLTEEMVKKAVEKTEPAAELIILDWKGLGEHKERIVKILEDLKLNFTRTSNFS
ncbi:D-tyrosyl-tRNA(Tyr) deacylase [Candidatus Woesearchaeota archaeon]|nr:D-tyrosyl-tRNA(Tyr) deacylase [Candidatus Woesearchaeota archaeon]